jgi:hypothetical protein
MKLPKAHKSILFNSSTPEKTSRLAPKPFGIQTQKASVTPKTKKDIENEAFQQQKVEATKLEIQAKYGTITPEGKESLSILQAKMDGLLTSRLGQASLFGHNFANISVRRPETPIGIQTKLTLGKPGDQYEQEADETARQVVQQIHQPQKQRVEREQTLDNEQGLQEETNVIKKKQIGGLSLQKDAASNSVLGKSEFTPAPFAIQRYIENDAALAPGKVSDGGNIVMVDKMNVYATQAKIQEAIAALANSPARITLTQGAAFTKPDDIAWTTRFGSNQTLYRVKPVYKANAELTEKQAKTEPVANDSAQVEAKKLQLYKDSLQTNTLLIFDLKNEFTKRWQELASKRKGFVGAYHSLKSSVALEIWKEFNGKITNLIQKTMGSMWATSPTALAIFMPQGEQRDRLALEQHLSLFDSLATDYLDKFNSELAPEINMQELWMTLPNDCKNAALIMTGKNETELNQRSDNPEIGSNYGMGLGGNGEAMNYGWATHYATVIMKDVTDHNTDNLSFETAASIEAGMSEGKSLGFFEMYGNANPVQTFEYTTWRKNRDNVIRQANADLAQATTHIARQKVINERNADLARIDSKLAKLALHPDEQDAVQ